LSSGAGTHPGGRATRRESPARARDWPAACGRARHRCGTGARGAELRRRGARAWPVEREASDWIRVPVRGRPLQGQIVRLQAPGPPVVCSVGWGHNYATTKTDGLLWAGTTEEEAGFDEESTPAARDEIGAALMKMLPAMADAQVAQQTACLRPVAS